MSDVLQSATDGVANISKSDDVTKRLLALIDRCDYQLVQENGQRRLTSASSVPRIKGAEVFLGRLPRDCYEDELVPLLSTIGRVVELRLMMDFSGSTRGYAFALFENQRIARSAIEKLNGYEIRPGHRIGVVKSIDNCRLFLGGVPKDKTRADFMEELGKMLDGITNIYVYPSTEDKALNRGFVFVEFKDHRSAAMARRKLIPGRVMLWNHEVAVDWADPEPGQDVDDEIMETVSALFVRNLNLDTTESEVKNTIQRSTGVPIMKIKKINHFAFLHYETRAQAQRVLDIMRQPGRPLSETSEWELAWAKPIRKSEKLEERLRCAKNGGSKAASHGGSEFSARKIQAANCNEKNLALDASGKRISVVTTKSTKITDSKPPPSHSYCNAMMNNDMPSGNVVVPCLESCCNPYYRPFLTDRNTVPLRYNVVNYDLCAKALVELAAKEFQANLRYECFADSTKAHYFCKIILERNGYELMNYKGDPAATAEQAFRFTVRAAYESLQSMLIYATEYNN
ncbi:RNA-binding protein 47 [Neodiprion pinetum]|uniref:RNA-binding protein 47 n=1 Tax=Neodiprion pinetum TaxID=441929 RepID=UPI001EE13F41|nr:RNA-binding protein 47-like [Neodiprion pinetum]